MRWPRRAGVLLIGLLAAGFAYLNRGEWVTIRLGFIDLYRVGLSSVVFAAFLLGMIAMFLLGLRQDLRIRRVLRERQLGSPLSTTVPDEPLR